MSIDGGPWGPRDPGPEPAAAAEPRRRGPPQTIAWPVLVLMAGVGVLVVALMKAFPEARLEGQGWGDVAYQAGFVLVVATVLWRSRRLRPGQLLSYCAIWVAIVAGLAIGFAYKDEIMGVPQRIAIAFGTGRPVATGAHELVISQDTEGAFQVVGQVNGQPVRFMVDTGATETVLAPQDARRLGVDTSSLSYDVQSETANGKGFAAPYEARTLEVGPIRMSGFKMEINKAPMSNSLLGLSFLKRLESYEFRGRKLYLKWLG